MYSMNYIGKFISNFRDFYNEINTATLTGAIDVIVVEQPDGTFNCSPFHVRFGKLGVLRSREKVVDIEINGEPLDIHMKLGDAGEAFFVEEVSSDELGDDVPPHLACSPIPTEAGFQSHFESQLSIHAGQTDDWSRRRCNSDIVKRRPKETIDQKFAQDDIAEHKTSSDIVYEWNPEYSSVAAAAAAAACSTAACSTASCSTASCSAPASSTTAPVPKTFTAKTVHSSGDSDKKARVSGEFRPITDDVSPISPPGGTETAVTTPDEGPEDSSKSASVSNKRRRRKRSVMKKKVSGNQSTPQRKNSEAGEASDTSTSVVWESATSVLSNAGRQTDPSKCESEPVVFSMDDLDGPQASSSHSSSTAAETISADTPTTPVDVSKSSASLADEISRDLSKIQNSSTEVDFHFFSDTEILPGNHSPDEEDSRPCSPVQSDTEFETTKRPSSAEASGQASDPNSSIQQSWRWGELPSPPPKHNSSTVPIGNISSDDEMSKQQDTGECASPQRDEDAESGNGPSLPQSPHSVEGAIGGPKSVDSDFEEPKHSYFERKHFGDICVSLCGNLNTPCGPSEECFSQNLVTFNDMVHNPKLLEDPNLVIRCDGHYYNWKTASPLLLSLLVFQQPLPQEVMKKLSSEHMPNTQSEPQHLTKTSEAVSGGRGYSSWFYWRRSSNSEPKKLTADSGPMNDNKTSTSTIVEMPDDSFRDRQAVDSEGRPLLLEIPAVGAEVTISQGRGNAQDHLSSLPKDALREEGYNGSNSSDSDDARRVKSQSVKIPMERRSYYQYPEKYRKTLRLSSEQIAQLNLQKGTNEVVFSVTTAYQGTTRCKCNIYRWRYDDKIVISDIDGTITKSDVLGHILPIVGKDWAQSGVAQLFTKIQNNGYRLLYLSARAIGQARVTREYLRSIKQDDLSLPDGPLLLSPTSLMSALHREVIERKPEEFKISCLRDIQTLFPSHCKPFYAGYGNKINDVWAYRAVGIPIFRIFTINHRGELKHELTQTFQSSYLNMSCIVDQMFPARFEEVSEDFSNFVFWREPIAEFQVPSSNSLSVNAISSTSVPTSGSGKDSPKKGKK